MPRENHDRAEGAPVSFRLSEAEKVQLRRKAKSEKRTTGDLIRWALVATGVLVSK